MKKSLLMLAAAAPLLVACGASSVSESDVESTTKEQLAADPDIGESVEKVECPGDLKAEKDATMDCAATVGGEEIGITLTVTKVEDNTAEWTIDVAE